MDATALIALAALFLTNIALIIGWVVTGTQRVAEDLVKERRTTYGELLSAVELARREGRNSATVHDALARAEFVATDEMLASQRLRRLTTAIDASETDYVHARSAFLVPARFESQKNQERRRRRERRSLYGLHSGGSVPPTPEGRTS